MTTLTALARLELRRCTSRLCNAGHPFQMSSCCDFVGAIAVKAGAPVDHFFCEIHHETTLM